MIGTPIEPKINDTNNGILTIWGIDFDATGKSLHLPNFKQSWIRFDMECLFTILTIGIVYKNQDILDFAMTSLNKQCIAQL